VQSNLCVIVLQRSRFEDIKSAENNCSDVLGH